MNVGSPLNDVTSSFIANTEFKSLYGNRPSNTDFVRLLYNNVLDRDLDRRGLRLVTKSNGQWIS
jgi:hypothetical protein